MYEEFYGFCERPFSLLPDPDFLYLSKKHDAELTLLNYGLTNNNALSVIIGEAGTGKTTLIRHLLNHLGKDITIGLITNTHSASEELMQWVLLAFDLGSPGKSKVERYRIFSDFLKREHVRDRRALLVIDEAQNMSSGCLGELILLSNISAYYNQVLQIVLVGQSALYEILQRPELENIRQRIGVDYHLAPLNREETHYYILHRLRIAGGKDLGLFSAEARDTIFRYSGGIPRLINLLCETALVYGFSEHRRTIDTALIEEVARDKKAGGIIPLQGDLWKDPLGPQLTSGSSVTDSVTQPYVFFKHHDEVTSPLQEACSKGGSEDCDHPFLSLRSPAASVTEAFHAMPGQAPISTPSNYTVAAAPKPTSSRSDKARQVALCLGLVLAVGLLVGYRLLRQEYELFTSTVSRSITSASKPLAIDQSLVIGQNDRSEKEDQSPAVARPVPDKKDQSPAAARPVPDEERPAVKPSDLDGERPRAVVKAGDTLTHIIKRAYGRYEEATFKAILRDNPEIQNPDLIQVGQVIRLPR